MIRILSPVSRLGDGYRVSYYFGSCGPELPFFHKRKDVLKIDQSVKMP